MGFFQRLSKKDKDNPFKDVFNTDDYYAAVMWAVKQGVAEPDSDGLFDPRSGCTRAQAVTFLWRVVGSPAPAAVSSPFIDVKDTDDCFAPVMWAVENGIGSEIGEGVFAANASVTRAQILTMLHRAVGKPAAVKREWDFIDVTEQDFYFEAMLWALEKDIAEPLADGVFAPYSVCARSQVIEFLYKAYSIASTSAEVPYR